MNERLMRMRRACWSSCWLRVMDSRSFVGVPPSGGRAGARGHPVCNRTHESCGLAKAWTPASFGPPHTPSSRFRVFAAAFAAVLLSAGCASAADWEKLPPLPAPNGGFVCGVQGSRIIVAGGTNWEGGVKNWLREVHEFDPAKKKWETGKPLEKPVAYAAAFQSRDDEGGGLVSFVGGSDGRRPLKSFVGLDGAKTKFRAVGRLPDAVVSSAGGQLGDRDIIVGGTDDAANLAGCQRTVHSLQLQDNTWVVAQLANYPGRPFCTAASTVCGAELFVFGGANWDEKTKDAPNAGVVNSNEAFAFSGITSKWRPLEPMPFAARGMAAISLDNERIYLAGGYKSDPEGFTAEAFIYDATAGAYSPARPLPYAASVSLVIHDGFLYCIGGEDMKKHRSDAFFRIKADALQ